MNDELETDEALEADEATDEGDLGDAARTKGGSWTDPDPDP